MAKIARATMKIFGSSAGANQIAQFGSLNAGTPTFTTSIATIQSLSNYLVGWFNAVIGGNSPAIEDMNAICYLYAYQLAYICQEGVAEWDSGTTYYAGSIVNDGSGNLYVSLLDTNLNNALSNTTYWRASVQSSLPQYNIPVGDSNSAPQPTNTNIIGDIKASFLSQSYTVTNAAPGVFTVAVAPITGATCYVTVTQNGFTASTRYYATNVSGTTFKLATTLANALAGTNITSSGTTSGTIITGGLVLQTGSLANPMTTLGDLAYGGSTPVAGSYTRLAGDTSNTKKFLRTQSSAGTATAPAWDTIAQGDLPALSQYNVNVGDSTSAAQQVNTSLIGDIQGSFVSQSYTVTNAAPGVFTVAVAPQTGATCYVTATQNGFTLNTRYYATNVSGTTFKLATTLANAIAGTNITSSGTTAGVIITGGFVLQTGSLANPMTTLGDLVYGGSTPAAGTYTRLAGDTSNTRKFLRTVSTAGVSAAPAWDTIVAGDLPNAGSAASGIVTTSAQNFGGAKTFDAAAAFTSGWTSNGNTNTAARALFGYATELSGQIYTTQQANITSGGTFSFTPPANAGMILCVNCNSGEVAHFNFSTATTVLIGTGTGWAAGTGAGTNNKLNFNGVSVLTATNNNGGTRTYAFFIIGAAQ